MVNDQWFSYLESIPVDSRWCTRRCSVWENFILWS
jgi:hypothetical protein